MKVLFIGGTGVISSACTRLAAGARHRPVPAQPRPDPHARGPPRRRPHHRRRRLQGARARRRPVRPHVRRGGQLHQLHARRRRARFAPVPRQGRPVPLHQLLLRLPEAAAGLPGHRVHAAGQPLLAIRPRKDRLRAAADRRATARAASPPPSSARRSPTATRSSPWRSTASHTPGRWWTGCCGASRSSYTATAPDCGPAPTTLTSPRASSACSATTAPSATPSTSPATRC